MGAPSHLPDSMLGREFVSLTPHSQLAHALSRMPGTVSRRHTTSSLASPAPRGWATPSSLLHQPRALLGTHPAFPVLLQGVCARTPICASRHQARERPQTPTRSAQSPGRKPDSPLPVPQEEQAGSRAATSAGGPSGQDPEALQGGPAPKNSPDSSIAHQNTLEEIRRRPVELQACASCFPPSC